MSAGHAQIVRKQAWEKTDRVEATESKKTESKNSSGSSVELCHVEGPGKIFLLFQASTLADTGSSQNYARFWVPILIRRLAL